MLSASRVRAAFGAFEKEGAFSGTLKLKFWGSGSHAESCVRSQRARAAEAADPGRVRFPESRVFLGVFQDTETEGLRNE